MSAKPHATLYEFQFALLSKVLKDWPAEDIQFIVSAVRSQRSYEELLDTAKKFLEAFRVGVVGDEERKLEEAIAKAEARS